MKGREKLEEKSVDEERGERGEYSWLGMETGAEGFWCSRLGACSPSNLEKENILGWQWRLVQRVGRAVFGAGACSPPNPPAEDPQSMPKPPLTPNVPPRTLDSMMTMASASPPC